MAQGTSGGTVSATTLIKSHLETKVNKWIIRTCCNSGKTKIGQDQNAHCPAANPQILSTDERSFEISATRLTKVDGKGPIKNTHRQSSKHC